jgi:hypothetical protein
MKGEKAMTELEKLLDKIYRHADAQGTAQAQILSAFAEKDKRIAELEAQLKQANKSEISWLQAYQKKVRRLEAKLQKQSTIIKEARNENKKCYKAR